MSKRISDKDRYYIQIQLQKKAKVADIAKDLGFSAVAIYAEIKRGTCKQLTSELVEIDVYCWDYAARDAQAKRQNRHTKKKIDSTHDYLSRVCDLIKNKKYSPYAAMQILGKAPICEKTIYNYIESGYIPGINIYNLPYAKPKKKKKDKVGKRQPYEKSRSIDDRPKEIAKRASYGHWEMDTVYSSKDDLHCLLVLSERMSREEIVIKIKDRTASSVVKALDGLERKIGTPAFKEKFKTITCDNGVEFSRWQDIERSCRTKSKRTVTYFCHPYASSERGTNENINRMIRRWIPKGDDIGLYSASEIMDIMHWINNYPRKIFNGKSAFEFLQICTDAKIVL